MSSNLEKAANLLKTGRYTFAAVSGEKEITSVHRGVKPLLELLDGGGDLHGFSAADKVIGKAAAFIYVLLKPDEIYAEVISKPAIEVLEKYGVKTSFGTLAEAIRNRKNTGFCPMETAVKNAKAPDDALALIRKTLEEISKQQVSYADNCGDQNMARIFLICGKICCGKSTYAEHLRIDNNAVLLSVDELMLALFGPYAGDKHDQLTEKIQKYLFEKSAEIVKCGSSVILDWGFWSEFKRNEAKEFYKVRGIECEFHYIDISDEVWKERIAHRNELILNGDTTAYFIDDDLTAKFEGLFEQPSKDEIDVWVQF